MPEAVDRRPSPGLHKYSRFIVQAKTNGKSDGPQTPDQARCSQTLIPARLVRNDDPGGLAFGATVRNVHISVHATPPAASFFSSRRAQVLRWWPAARASAAPSSLNRAPRFA